MRRYLLDLSDHTESSRFGPRRLCCAIGIPVELVQKLVCTTGSVPAHTPYSNAFLNLPKHHNVLYRLHCKVEPQLEDYTTRIVAKKASTKDDRTAHRRPGAGLPEFVLFGSTPLPTRPKYHFPMSVNLPPTLSMVALVPIFDTDDRNAPKNE